VVLLGEGDGGLGGSEYLEAFHGKIAGVPKIALDLEKRLDECLIAAIGEGILRSAHDCSDGGLTVALAESCITGRVGFKGEIAVSGRLDAALFGEGQSRAIVSLPRSNLKRLEEIAARFAVPLRKIGTIGGDRFRLEMLEEGRRGSLIDLPLDQLADAWEGGLERMMGGESARRL